MGASWECLSLLVCLDQVVAGGCLCSLQFFSDQLCPQFFLLTQPDSEQLSLSLKGTLSFHWEQGNFRKASSSSQIRGRCQAPSPERPSHSWAVSSWSLSVHYWSCAILEWPGIWSFSLFAPVALCSGIAGIGKHFFGRLVAVTFASFLRI